ncbi:WD repeat and HMG-box DNA-binding protein 1-like [Mantella aurantiaca]
MWPVLKLSCRLECEFRCTELAESMTHNVMSLAIKYASRSKRLTLAQRLSELALEKAAELASAQKGEGEEDQRGGLNAEYSRNAAEWGESRDRRAEEEEDVEKNGEEEEGEEPEEEEEEAAPVPPRLGRAAMNSFSKNVASPEQPTTKSGAIDSSNQGRVNPFKIWTEKAKGDDAGDSKKRKRAEQEKRDSAEDPREESQDSGATKKRKPFHQSANQKLSAFAFNKD